MSLRDIVLDYQHRPIGSDGIPTVEAEEVRDRIVIVVFLKAQAELGDAGPVDKGIGSRLEGGHIPAAGLRVVREQSNARLARGLEVCSL